MIPQWGRTEFLTKAHFYMEDGRSICGKTKLRIKVSKKYEVLKDENLLPVYEHHFCKYCVRKLTKRLHKAEVE